MFAMQMWNFSSADVAVLLALDLRPRQFVISLFVLYIAYYTTKLLL